MGRPELHIPTEEETVQSVGFVELIMRRKRKTEMRAKSIPSLIHSVIHSLDVSDLTPVGQSLSLKEITEVG